MADVSQIKLPNGSVYDLIDEKSGYITAEYIENKTDYEIPVSRVGEIVVGETAIGTDSTNFPTSKAVVDYVDERVVQEIDAIDVGVTSVNGKTGSVTLNASDVGALPDSTVIPSKTSDLTNDSGFLTTDSDEKLKTNLVSNTETTYYPIFGNASSIAENKQYSDSFKFKWDSRDAKLTLGKQNDRRGVLQIWCGNYITYLYGNGNSTGDHVVYLPAQQGTIALTSDIPDTSSFLTSETDPVFSVSAAAGITATDISNWNAKVSDTGKWNDVSLTKSQVDTGGADILIPYVLSTSATEAKLVTAGDSTIAKTIAIRDANGYIRAKTPSANDNSTKVATTAYVDAATPKVYSSTNTGGYLTMATLPIYDGTVE